MNRRISRIALLVVLLLSLLGVAQQAQGTTKLALAQGEFCQTYIDSANPDATPEAGDQSVQDQNFILDSIFSTPPGADTPFEQTLLELTLLEGGQVSILPDESAIVRVDSGNITLWNCGNSDIEVLQSGSSEPKPVGPGGNEPIPVGAAIYIAKGDVYYLENGPIEDATPLSGMHQIDNAKSFDALPVSNLQPSESKLNAGILGTSKLCAKGSCRHT